MGLADLLKNSFRLKQLYSNENLPHIQGLQMDEDGTVKKVDIPNEFKPSLTSRIADVMLGKQLQTPDSIGKPQVGENGEMVIDTTINNNPRTGGLLRDIAEGYKENRNTPISLDNFSPEAKKNWATRIGEGLGTMARFADSPLGRSALVGATIGLTGGNGLQALTYGTSTGALNQRNRMADELYRDDLSSQGINIDNIRGYVTNDAYKDLLASKQLKDNAEWRKTYFDANQMNLEEQREWQRQQYLMSQEDKRQERAERRYENARNREVTMRGQDLSYRSNLDKLIADGKNNGNYEGIEKQLNNFSDTFKKVNNPYRYRAFGGVSNALNTLTTGEANFNSQRTLLFNVIARQLGEEKGVLSDQDIKRIDDALPRLSDTMEQKQAKMKAVYALLDIKKGNNRLNDPLGIR